MSIPNRSPGGAGYPPAGPRDPERRAMPALNVLLLAGLMEGAAFAADLSVSTDFPGGSAEVRSLDAAAGRIVIAPASHPGRGWPCWWYFRVDGAQPGQTLTLEVGASREPFRPDQRLAASWALPERPAISADDAVWSQIEPGVLTKEGGTYQITAPAPRFWLAWGPPFLPAHAETLLEAVARNLPGSRRFVLAETREGRPVNGLRLGTPGAPQAIWVQARQHAWESGGSWVGHGFLEWAASDHPDAIQLRRSTEIFFIPIMDVDNVVLGLGGKEAVPRDHNRDWADAPVYPEVSAAQQRIRALAEAGRLRVFMDLHNPGPNDRRPYFFGPFDYEQMTGARRVTYDRFLALAVEQMTGPLAIQPKFRFATYVKTEEERGRMSGAWVRNLSGENVVAMTLETAWNTPHSTAEGYRKVGGDLARTIARFLARP
jgi:hypothetical protein